MQALEGGATYVWWINLDVGPEVVDCAMWLLNAQERSRADRIASREVFRDFVLTRAAARFLLAGHTGLAPEELSFVTGRYGKPAVGGAGIAIEFNVTHSRGQALVCASLDRQVGVDIEYVRHMPDLDLVSPLTLTASEQAAVSAAPEAFLRCWVRKEAVVKAAGIGLSASLCDVEVTTSNAPVTIHLTDAQDRSIRYEVMSLKAPRGYHAAIACERSVGELVVNEWRWS